MSTRRKGKADLKSARSEVGTLDNEYWMWGFIFTIAAVTALFIATLFAVGNV